MICEANRTHTGKLKKYSVEKVLKKNGILLDKIYIHKVELPFKEEEPNNWVRERKQRDDIWFISDCDEIINPNYLEWCKKIALDNIDFILRPVMSFHIGKANLQTFHKNNTPLYWHAPFFVLKKHIEKYTLSQIREAVAWEQKIDFPSICITLGEKLIEMGWHLSWMGTSNNRISKLEAMAHYNDCITNGIGYLNTLEAKNYVKNYIPKEGLKNVLARTDHVVQKYDVSKLPNLILENQKLRKFFLGDYIPHTYKNLNFGEDWFTYPDLYKEMVEKFDNSIFVKIGSWKGKSSSYMATEIANSKKNIKFFCVDT